tara:strand:- start:2475 stop:4139 length:1665 start_codon:yes stop_codon:yes gene_type:complete
MGPPDSKPTPNHGTENFFVKNSAWLLLVLIVVATLLRLPLLDRSIWYDEACMSSQRIGSTPQLLATLYTDIQPPLFAVFMHLWYLLFGDGEVVMRLPAMISGILCIPLTYWVGYRLIGRAPALMAAALLTLSPVHVWYSTEARLYAPMILTTLFAFGCIDRLTDQQRGPRPWLFWSHLLNVVVMLSLHYYLAVLVVVLAGLAPILMRGMTERARSLVMWHGIGILGLAGYVMAKLQLGEFETSQDYVRTLNGRELFRFLFEWSWSGNTMQASDASLMRGLATGFVWFGVGLTVLGVIRLVVHARRKPRALLVPTGVAVLPCFLFACVYAGYNNTYLERSLIPALPFLFLLAAAGLQVFPGKLRIVAGGTVLTLAATALINLYASFDTKWTIYMPHPDWRSAARYLSNEIQTGASGTPVFTSMPNPRSLSYYDVRIQDAKNLKVELSPADIGNKVRERLGDWLGDFAESSFSEFAAYNQAMYAGAELLVYRCKSTPAELPRMASRTDATCYLVRNKWHPHRSVDGSVEALLAHPRTEVLHTERCTGVTVYKVRFK